MIYIVIGAIFLNIAFGMNLYSEGIPIEDILNSLIIINSTVIGFACIFEGLFS